MPYPLCALALVAVISGCAVPADQMGKQAAIPAAAQIAAAEGQPRQIIYRATLVLSVEDFGETERKIGALIQTSGGYLAQFREDRPAGALRGGHWTVRIPVPRFEQFLEATGKLGVAEQREVLSDDVTEEYVDLSSRLKNKQQLETRLLELVAKRTDEIKDVIALEAELNRVREEVERMQGRLRYLSDRVALTTVEITAYERHDYRPPEALSFAGQVAHTFSDSLHALQQFVEACLLAVVALLPWLLAASLLVAPLIWYIRRRLRRSRPIVQAQTV